MEERVQLRVQQAQAGAHNTDSNQVELCLTGQGCDEVLRAFGASNRNRLGCRDSGGGAEGGGLRLASNAEPGFYS